MKLIKVNLNEVKTIQNSRPNDFDYSELMESIKESGVIQPPVVAKNFTKKYKSPYLLVAGNRRMAALKKLGVKEVEVVINENIKNETDLLIFNMSENLQRKDVSAFEQGRLMDLLVNKHNLNLKECAVRLGISKEKAMKLYDAYKQLPTKYSKKVVYDTKNKAQRKGKIPLSIATYVNNLKKSNLITASQGSKLLDGVIDERYTHRDIQEFKERLRDGVSFNDVVKGVENIVYVAVRVAVYSDQKNEVEGDIKEYIESIIYGETIDHFDRPEM